MTIAEHRVPGVLTYTPNTIPRPMQTPGMTRCCCSDLHDRRIALPQCLSGSTVPWTHFGCSVRRTGFDRHQGGSLPGAVPDCVCRFRRGAPVCLTLKAYPMTVPMRNCGGVLGHMHPDRTALGPGQDLRNFQQFVCAARQGPIGANRRYQQIEPRPHNGVKVHIEERKWNGTRAWGNTLCRR